MNQRPLRIAHLYPDLLNLYGDGGNILALVKRCEWRGIPVEVSSVLYGEHPTFGDADIVFLGGGSDREQLIVCEQLRAVGEEIRSFAAEDGVLLAVCGGYQLLGHSYQMGDQTIEGLGLIDLWTVRGAPRIVGNIMIDCDLQDMPVVGYENHGGRTHLGEGVKPLGSVIAGRGNNDVDGHEGCRWRNVVGTYIHGPLLPKNPGLADWAIRAALERRTGERVVLEPLDDAQERAANAVMCDRIRRGEG